MSVTEDTTATLRAEEHGHQPWVMQSSGFCTEPSAKSRSIGYEEERSPTLRAGVVPGVAIENHPTDGRCKVSTDGKVQTLTSSMGTGGMNVPLVMNALKTLKIRSGCEGGGKGALVQDDMSAALSCDNDQTVVIPTAYGICSDKSNSMLSDNPHSGIYEAETSRTIDVNGGNPGCNQGGIAVVTPVVFTQNQRDEVRDLGDCSGSLPAHPGMKQQTYVLQGSMIGRNDKNGPQGSGVDEDVSFTLNTIDRHAVAQPASFSPHPDYIVRRLTPTECARLQGFPDWWCDELDIAEPSDEDIAYWREVFETHRRLVTGAKRPKSNKQICKWLKHPHSDAAEYKMWGNGIALPCAVYVMKGFSE